MCCFATHIVVDEAQEFTDSWRERLDRVGLDRINLASLSINYRTPEEVMAEAEPVIGAAHAEGVACVIGVPTFRATPRADR